MKWSVRLNCYFSSLSDSPDDPSVTTGERCQNLILILTDRQNHRTRGYRSLHSRNVSERFWAYRATERDKSFSDRVVHVSREIFLLLLFSASEDFIQVLKSMIIGEGMYYDFGLTFYNHCY